MMLFLKTSTFALSAALAACGGGGGHGAREVAAPTELRQASAPAGGQNTDENARWEKLGERTVQGKNDRDTIVVGHAGKFKEILLKVEGSSLDLYDITVTFGDGSTFSPATRLTFREGSTSRVIDLPGARRNITKIELRYGNLPGGGRARMEVLAR